MKRGAPLARLALVLALGLAGCGGEADSAVDHAATSQKPAYGDTFIEALTGNISGLIPNIVGDGASHTVAAHMYNGLITHDRDISVVPDLAESWTLARDCRDLTFRLRNNVRWHDGRPFTADDVVFTYRLMTHPKTPSPYKDDFAAVESVLKVLAIWLALFESLVARAADSSFRSPMSRSSLA